MCECTCEKQKKEDALVPLDNARTVILEIKPSRSCFTYMLDGYYDHRSKKYHTSRLTNEGIAFLSMNFLLKIIDE